MGRQIIELVQVLVDRIEKNGYTQRALEDDIYEASQKRIAAEKDRDHWMAARKDAIAAGELMQADIETLRQQLDAAHQTILMQRAGIERLRKFAEQVREVYSKAHPHNWMTMLHPALAELDAEPTPATEAEGGK